MRDLGLDFDRHEIAINTMQVRMNRELKERFESHEQLILELKQGMTRLK